MIDYKRIRSIFNSSGASGKKMADGSMRVSDSSFRGMRMTALDEAKGVLEAGVKDEFRAACRESGMEFVTLKDAQRKAKESIGGIIDVMRGAESVSVRDSILNGRWNLANRADPTASTYSSPNVYISPWEANSLYSQKGIFETVINKKAMAVLLNGISIENPRLSDKQKDIIMDNLIRRDIKNVIADSLCDSLVYGGALVFPMFRRDSAMTVGLPLSSLIKLGVVGKDCIEYFVNLDRWNTFIIPPTNPTQRDFYDPDYYTVPFLGADVSKTRCSRIVASRQAGFWGTTMTQGWGISDFCGYVQSGLNYKAAVQAIPLMIQQMSILARVVNVDGVLATEGSNALDSLLEEATVRTREASPDNPITLDVLGEIKSINRNFAQVPELMKLLRQDFSGDAGIPEPMIWSSEKGAFSSGSDADVNEEKQWECTRIIHKRIEPQFSRLCKIIVIDALGTDNDIIEALPYTRVHFDEPVIANAVERAQIGKLNSEDIFNLVAARIPIDVAVEMAGKHLSSDMAVSNDVMEKLRKIQERADMMDKERFNKEIEKADLSNKMTEEYAKAQKIKNENEPLPTENEPSGKGGGYSPIEQKAHEVTRVNSTHRNEGIGKARGKFI